MVTSTSSSRGLRCTRWDGFLRSIVVRPIAYDPLARVYTATPSTMKALFKQRVRWNTSRAWLLQRFGLMPFIAWELGAWVVTELLLTLDDPRVAS